jgi:hypothetical protein
MVAIELSGGLALVLALLGAGWIYVDGRERNMDSADMWAVAFFVGMFIPPIIGAVVVGTLYLDRRNRGGRKTHPARRRPVLFCIPA